MSPFGLFSLSRHRLSAACVALLLGALAARAEGLAPAPPIGGAAEFGMASGVATLRDRPDAELEAEFADYASLGAEWLRTDLYWANVQPDGPRDYDWRTMDRIVDLAQAQGLKVLPVIGTTPPWARSIPAERSAPADPADYAAFVAEAVRRYAPRGIRAWEIWNEPNMGGAWPPAPDAVAYARLLRAAYPAIKAVDPEAIVIAGGLASVVDTDPKHIAAVEFLETVYAQGAGGSFDALGYHPYSYPRMPGDPASWTGWSLMTGPIRDLMIRNGDAAKKIWITEFGAPTNERRSKVSEAEQAEMLSQARTLAEGYDWAGPLFWYSYRDLGTDPGDNEDWFGLLRHDGTPKDGYATLRSIAKTRATSD